MADSNIALRQWLLGEPTIVALLGTNVGGSVYCGDLVKGFDPLLGPAIQITNVGGASDPEIITVATDLKQVRVWAGVQGYQQARALYLTVKKFLHGQNGILLAAPASAFIMACQETLAGQDITDPDTGWATVLGRFNLMFRDA